MKKGFTLIELLVVIGIIAMLVAIGIPNYLSARQRASDARTKSDMDSLKNALRLYYNDYQTYPAGTGLTMSGCGVNGIQACPVTTACSADFAAGPSTGCENVYMKRLPVGFLSSPNSIRYYQAASGNDFCLSGTLGNLSDTDISTSQTRCASACGTSYCSGTGKYCACAD